MRSEHLTSIHVALVAGAVFMGPACGVQDGEQTTLAEESRGGQSRWGPEHSHSH